MKIPNIKKNAVCFIAFAGVAILSFVGGTKLSSVRPHSEAVASPSPNKYALMDSDVISELKDGGVRIVSIRAAGGRSLNQYIFDSDGTLFLRAAYRIDASGLPLTCKITDAQKTEIFKVRYGYRRSDGMLVEERIFDSRNKRVGDEGEELPLRRILHVVDAVSGESTREMIELVASDFPRELEGGFRNPFQKL